MGVFRIVEVVELYTHDAQHRVAIATPKAPGFGVAC
jgi:hypothetical protein